MVLCKLSYDCYGSVLRHPESDKRSIDKSAAVVADPTTAEAASPRSIQNDTHSDLPRRVSMETKECSKMGRNPSWTVALQLFA